MPTFFDQFLIQKFAQKKLMGVQIEANGKETDLTFTIKTEDLNKTKKIIQSNRSIKFRKLILKKDVSKIGVNFLSMEFKDP